MDGRTRRRVPHGTIRIMRYRATMSERLGLAAVAFAGLTAAACYVGLPAALTVGRRLGARPIVGGRPLPPVISVVIAAHNEQADLPAKLTDLQHQELPAGVEMQVIVASDGSSDETVALASDHPLDPVVLDLPRGGKAQALNAALALAKGDIVVFSDANSRLGPEALDVLLAPFADPDVGGVAGRQRYGDPSQAITGESEYWAYEDQLKILESSVGSVVSATGALYAVRRHLIEEVPPDVTDDFFISTGVVAAGRRLVYEPRAVAWEDPSGSPASEYRRKVRIITRGLTGVRRRRGLLNPVRHGHYALVLLMHKVLRRLMFVPLSAGAVGMFLLRNIHPLVRLATWSGLAAGALAGLAIRYPESALARFKPIRLLSHFIMVNIAAAHAVLNVARSREFSVWDPERPDGPGRGSLPD